LTEADTWNFVAVTSGIIALFEGGDDEVAHDAYRLRIVPAAQPAPSSMRALRSPRETNSSMP